MVMSNMLKMFFHHFKKLYLFYSVTFIILGSLFFIESFNISFDYVSINTVIVNAFLISSIIISGAIGSEVYSNFGKTLSLVQNNKLPILINGTIWSIVNGLLFTIIFLVFRLNSTLIIPNLFLSLIGIFLTYIASYFIGALCGLLLKDKMNITLITFIILLTLCFSFKAMISTYFNLYSIFISEGFIDGSTSVISSAIISIVLLIAATTAVYLCKYPKKSTF